MIDASAALAALLRPGRARDSLASQQAHAPHLIDCEVANGLRRHVAPDPARVALATWSQLGITRHPHVGLLNRIWALRHNLSAYDATYVALAEALDCALLTADARLARAPGIRCPVTVIPRA